MKITDLGFDCLESCFRHLSIETLLNVADSNKKLRHVARYVFYRMHGRKAVHLNEVRKFQKEENLLRLSEKIVSILQLKLALQFLRCFGDLFLETHVEFTKLCDGGKMTLYTDSRKSICSQSFIDYLIHCENAHKWQHRTVEYINEYCTQSLNHIKFGGAQNGDLNKLTKPFVKVEKLTCNVYIPSEKKLHEIFPKVSLVL